MAKFDHEYTDEIVCPYCGYIFPDSYDVGEGEEDIGRVDCGGCVKEFLASRHVSITYSTEKLNEGICRKCGKEAVISNRYMYSNAKVNVQDYCDDCITEAVTNAHKGIETIDRDLIPNKCRKDEL